jgi:hypothetical protein
MNLDTILKRGGNVVRNHVEILRNLIDLKDALSEQSRKDHDVANPLEVIDIKQKARNREFHVPYLVSGKPVTNEVAASLKNQLYLSHIFVNNYYDQPHVMLTAGNFDVDDLQDLLAFYLRDISDIQTVADMLMNSDLLMNIEKKLPWNDWSVLRTDTFYIHYESLAAAVRSSSPVQDERINFTFTTILGTLINNADLMFRIRPRAVTFAHQTPHATKGDLQRELLRKLLKEFVNHSALHRGKLELRMVGRIWWADVIRQCQQLSNSLRTSLLVTVRFTAFLQWLKAYIVHDWETLPEVLKDGSRLDVYTNNLSLVMMALDTEYPTTVLDEYLVAETMNQVDDLLNSNSQSFTVMAIHEFVKDIRIVSTNTLSVDKYKNHQSVMMTERSASEVQTIRPLFEGSGMVLVEEPDTWNIMRSLIPNLPVPITDTDTMPLLTAAQSIHGRKIVSTIVLPNDLYLYALAIDMSDTVGLILTDGTSSNMDASIAAKAAENQDPKDESMIRQMFDDEEAPDAPIVPTHQGWKLVFHKSITTDDIPVEMLNTGRNAIMTTNPALVIFAGADRPNASGYRLLPSVDWVRLTQMAIIQKSTLDENVWLRDALPILRDHTTACIIPHPLTGDLRRFVISAKVNEFITQNIPEVLLSINVNPSSSLLGHLFAAAANVEEALQSVGSVFEHEKPLTASQIKDREERFVVATINFAKSFALIEIRKMARVANELHLSRFIHPILAFLDADATGGFPNLGADKRVIRRTYARSRYVQYVVALHLVTLNYRLTGALPNELVAPFMKMMQDTFLLMDQADLDAEIGLSS